MTQLEVAQLRVIVEPVGDEGRQTDMARLCIALLALVSFVLAGCGADDTEVGAGGGSATTTTTPGEDPEDGDCAAHDEAGMCIDDPEESLSGVELPECAPEEDCLTVTKSEPDPGVAAFAERLRSECDEFQAVVDSLPNGSVTVGEALAILDEVEPAFARWADAADALEPPPERDDEWRRLLADVVDMTEAATAYFRAVFVELDPSMPVEEAFADESQLPTDIQSQTEAIEAVDDFLGYRCLN